MKAGRKEREKGEGRERRGERKAKRGGRKERRGGRIVPPPQSAPLIKIPSFFFSMCVTVSDPLFS